MTRLEAVHDGDRLATLETIADQASELYGEPTPTITCPCGDEWPFTEMYRCLYCAVYFCESCAEVHFD